MPARRGVKPGVSAAPVATRALGPSRNDGSENEVVLVSDGVTLATTVKLKGESWMARTRVRKMDSLRAFARLRLKVSYRLSTGSTTAQAPSRPASNAPTSNTRHHIVDSQLILADQL